MTIHWKAVGQYFTVVCTVCSGGKLINFGLGSVRSERVYPNLVSELSLHAIFVYTVNIEHFIFSAYSLFLFKEKIGLASCRCKEFNGINLNFDRQTPY